MKLRLLLTFVILVPGLSCLAQDLAVYQTYVWDASPTLNVIKKEWQTFPAVHVLHNQFLELRLEEGKVVTYSTEHRIIHINAVAGIERFARVYIPIRDYEKLMSLHVRSIDPKGNITNFNRENLKELNNVEGRGNFKIFAVEGLAVGGEMEYIYSIQGSPSSYGRYKIQSEIPVIEAGVVLLSPASFTFTGKSYNGLPQPSVSTLNKLKKVEVTARNVPAFIEEQYSAGDANQMRMDYRLEARSQTLTWDGLCQRMVMNNYEPNAGGKIKKLLKPLNLDGMQELEKVQAVEKFIKMNFTVRNGGGDAYDDTKTVIEKHVANTRGMLKLFMSCWEELGLRPMLVLCSNRFKGRIDPDFPSLADFSDVLFFFPTLNLYLSPTLPYLRLGAAPDQLAASHAIFVEFSFENGQADYRRYEVRRIPALNYLHNNMGIKALVQFKDKVELPQVNQETFWQGYRAAAYRGFYYYAPETEKSSFLKNVTLAGIENASVLKQELEGDDVNLSFDTDSYFRVKTRYTASSLTEQSGGDYLFAVGKLIGRQSELYQEKERKTDIEFQSISNYNHEIVVEIPEGYTCTGLEAIKINNTVNNGKEEVMKFQSDYESDGNKVIIKVNEFYKVLQLPKENYEAFRKVVNSAADFNKVVLVLHPVDK